MVSPQLAGFFKWALWLLEVKVQAVLFFLILLLTAWWAWGFYEGIPLLNRVIVVLFLGLIPALLFKGLSFFLLAFMDFTLVTRPSTTVDVKMPVEKVAARLERALTDRQAPHYSIASFTMASLEQLLLMLFRVRFKANMPYNVVATRPFVVVRAIQPVFFQPRFQARKIKKTATAEERPAVTHVTIINEDTQPGRSLAKVLETSLRVF